MLAVCELCVCEYVCSLCWMQRQQKLRRDADLIICRSYLVVIWDLPTSLLVILALNSKRKSSLPVGQDSPGKTPFCPRDPIGNPVLPSGSHRKPHSSPQDSTRNPLLPFRIPLTHLSVRIFLESSNSLSEFHGKNLLSVRIPSESCSVEFTLGIKTLNVFLFPCPSLTESDTHFKKVLICSLIQNYENEEIMS